MRNNHTKDPWYKCALYEVWRDMMKNARRMSKIIPSPDGFPVDPKSERIDVERRK